MSKKRTGRIVTLLFGPGLRPPRRVRLAFEAFGLVALAAVGAATDSDGLQLLVFVGLLLGLYPALERRFGVADAYMQAVRGHAPPIRVSAPSILFTFAWLAFIVEVVPEAGLGRWFWCWVVIWLYLEVNFFFAERDLRRHGLESWSRPRPVRDSLLTAAVVAPAITLLALSEDIGLVEALATGVACGLVLGVIVFVFEALQRRSQGPEEGQT